MPRLTKTPWFGPKRVLGWGWTPVTWQGWLVTGVFLAAIAACALFVSGPVVKVVVELALIAGLLAVCALTGTRPGGRGW